MLHGRVWNRRPLGDESNVRPGRATTYGVKEDELSSSSPDMFQRGTDALVAGEMD
jgi:hypothetical protein